MTRSEDTKSVSGIRLRVAQRRRVGSGEPSSNEGARARARWGAVCSSALAPATDEPVDEPAADGPAACGRIAGGPVIRRVSRGDVFSHPMLARVSPPTYER